MNKRIHDFLLIITLTLIIALTVTTSLHYRGSIFIYLFFTISSTLLFLNGLKKESIYFETFIGIFFWLGFWVKFSVRASFFDLKFSEPIGFYLGDITQIDRALVISSLGLSGFFCASLVRKYFKFFSYDQKPKLELNYLEEFYNKNRSALLVSYFLFSLLVASINIYFGIYQKGLPTQTVLPFGINRIVTWLILFGLSSIGSFFVYYDFKKKRMGLLTIFLYFVDCFFTNVSLLSRGFILNGSSMVFANYFEELRGKKLFNSYISKILLLSSFLMMFIGSIFLVNYFRSSKFITNGPTTTYGSKSVNFGEIAKSTKVLFIDRWVGIEGAISVSSYQKLGWDLWLKAWSEKYKDNGTSFYDLNLINSPYTDQNLEKHHFISLPGLIAFFFYPASYLFLFSSCLALGLFASYLEALVFDYSGGNIFFSALIGQVIAYRFAHFGYAPAQSYLLFGTIFLNIFVFYFSNKALFLIKKLA